MGEVARIVVPEPPALTPTPDGSGAETQAQPYRLVVPGVATEPLIMEAADGTQFRWTPTELVYGDDSGLVDYIAGSAPATLITHGREARYHRTFPASDEVHIAQAEGRKYWLILHEPPRPPADWLMGEVWFGVSGLVNGIPLPPGRHEEMESGPFRFPKPIAEDLMGERMQGWYEVVDTDQGQQLFVCIPASWLFSEDRIYPVKVDPTVSTQGLAGATAPANHRKLWRFSDGTLIAAYFGVDGPGGAKSRISKDGGQTWSVPVGGDLAGSTPAITVDERGYIHQVCTMVNGSSIYAVYRLGKPNALYDTISWLQEYNLPVVYSPETIAYGSPVVTYFGETRKVHIPYRWGINVHLVELTVPDSGSIQETRRPLGGTIVDTLVATRDANLTVHVFGKPASGNGLSYVPVTYAGGSWTVGQATTLQSGESVVELGPAGVDSQGRVVVAYKAGSGYLRVIRGTAGNWSDISPASQAGSSPSFALGPNGEIYLLYANAGLKLRKHDGVGWGTESTLDPDATVAFPNVRADTAGNAVDVLYQTGASSPYTVKAYRNSLNQAPLAPSGLTRASFDATNPAQFTWTHNDPDPTDGQSAYQVQIWQDGMPVVDTGWVQSPVSSYTLPAGTLTNGQTYQWRVRTKDQAGLESPWSDYAVFQTSTKPVPTPFYPTTGNLIPGGEVVAQWSVSSQSSAIVRLYEDGSATPLQEHTVTDANARQRTLTGLVNGRRYRWSVQVTSAAGVQGDEVFSGVFDVVYTAPNPVRNLVAIADQALAAVTLRWSRDAAYAASFARSSVAYLSNGQQVASGQPRYDTVGGVSGVWVEEGTTNLLTANQSSVETDTTGLGTYSPNGSTLTRDTSVAWHGIASARATSTYSGTQTISVFAPGTAVTPGRVYTFSVMVKASVPGRPLRPTIHWRDGSGAVVSSNHGTAVTATGSWQRLVHSATAPTGAVTATVEVYLDDAAIGDSLWWDGAQLEERSYATSWTLGGTTRAAETLTHPTPVEAIESGEFSLEFDFTPMSNPVVPGRYPALWACVIDANNYYRLWVHETGRVYAEIRSGGIYYNTYHGSDPVLVQGQKYRIGFRLSGGKLSHYVNGVKGMKGDVAYVKPVGNLPATCQFGASPTANGLYGPACFSQNRPATDLTSTGPLTWDQYTVQLYSWANSLEGGTQPSIWSGQYEVLRDGVRIAVVGNPVSGDTEFVDYAVASGQTYTYAVRATGSNGTVGPGVQVQGGVTFEGWRFTPVGDPAAEVPFRYDWSSRRQRDEDRREVVTRGRYPITFRGPSKPFRLSITARYAEEDGLTPQEWAERIYALSGTLGYLRGPDGGIWYGELYAPQDQWERDMVLNARVISVQFVEKGPVPVQV